MNSTGRGVAVTVQPLALNYSDAARIAGAPIWTVREAVMVGALKAKKAGRSHIILVSELQKWLESLQDVKPSVAPSIVARRKTKPRETAAAIHPEPNLR